MHLWWLIRFDACIFIYFFVLTQYVSTLHIVSMLQVRNVLPYGFARLQMI